jgi:hypothetical protein
MTGHFSTARQPAVSYMMFRVSGAHTLDEFRKRVAADLARHPASLTSLQLAQVGWLMTYAVEEAAMREDRADIRRCSDWLRIMMNVAATRERETRETVITTKLAQRIGQCLKLKDELAMLQFKSRRLKDDGAQDSALESFARMQELSRQSSRQMSEHAARAYADILLARCRSLLATRDSASAGPFRQSLQSYLDLGLYKATRLHWNVLSVAVEAHAQGWLNLPGFIAQWRPEAFQLRDSHRKEAEAALACLRAAIPHMGPGDASLARAILYEVEMSPQGSPPTMTKPMPSRPPAA